MSNIENNVSESQQDSIIIDETTSSTTTTTVLNNEYKTENENLSKPRSERNDESGSNDAAGNQRQQPQQEEDNAIIDNDDFEILNIETASTTADAVLMTVATANMLSRVDNNVAEAFMPTPIMAATATTAVVGENDNMQSSLSSGAAAAAAAEAEAEAAVKLDNIFNTTITTTVAEPEAATTIQQQSTPTPLVVAVDTKKIADDTTKCIRNAIATSITTLSSALPSTTAVAAAAAAVGAAAKPPTPKSPTSPQSPSAAISVTAAACGPFLPHTASEPIFGLPLRRNQQQQKIKNYHDTKQQTTIYWSGSGTIDATTTATGGAGSGNGLASASTTVIKSGTVSASASPSMVRKISDSSACFLPRRVSFPKSDTELVTGYLEPANPRELACHVKSISEIAELYVISCQKHNTKPLQSILDHLKAVELNKPLRQPLLSLKSVKLAPNDCEALEEIFKRVQYKTIDLSCCDLDECAMSALFEMIEYYEATNELDISSNSTGMTNRGWICCTYMVSHSQELQVLIAQGNPISKSGAESLGNALSTSNLHTLKLEHCGLKGSPLSGLCFKLRHNRILKELWLAYNDLDCQDADAIGDLLKVNHYLELVDISNNNIRDAGLRHIVAALILQSAELERRSMLQRSAAIDDDDSLSSMETLQTTDYAVDINASKRCSSEDVRTCGNVSSDDDVTLNCKRIEDNKNDCCIAAAQVEQKTMEIKDKLVTDHLLLGSTSPSLSSTTAAAAATTTAVGSTMSLSSASSTSMVTDENDADDDTEDTVKTSIVVTKNTTTQSHTGGGQSMLDKLLSMNSDSSSDDGASNLSTDTIAAFCSDDASIISDDIFESSTTGNTNTKAATVASTPSMFSAASNTNSSAAAAAAGTVTNVELTLQQQGSLMNENNLLDLISLSEATNGGDSNSSECTTNGSSTKTPTQSLNNNVNQHQHQHHHHHNNNNTNNSSISNDSLHNHNSNSSHHNSHRHNNDTSEENTLQSSTTTGIFEVTAEESDCLISGDGGVRGISGEEHVGTNEEHSLLLQHSTTTRALDVNKNNKLGEDYDDTHSTDSAFESASEGDISRHMPDEFSRLSSSYESGRLDDMAKGLAIETATIATESTECLLEEETGAETLSSTPTPPTPPLARMSPAKMLKADDDVLPALRAPIEAINSVLISTLSTTSEVQASDTIAVNASTGLSPGGREILSQDSNSQILPPPPPPPKVTIAQDSYQQKDDNNSPTPTPPPPSTSPGGASHGMRRSESSCAFITPSTRNCSQSSDSLCSDNSLDGSMSSDLNFPASTQLNEKLTKNDTLTRQQRQQDPPAETAVRTPGGLKAIALWNNNLTKEAGLYIADLLADTTSLELLNIGKNCLSNDFVSRIKESLTKNTTLTTLGLQSAHLSATGIETLCSILQFGGNSTLQRIDIRDNKLEVESLTTIAELLKSNTTITQIDIDDEPKRLSIGSDAHLDYTRVLENVRSMCSRNEKTQAQMLAEKSAGLAGAGKRRGGYYLGSRKISLTCHSRPLIDTSTITTTTSTMTPLTPVCKLDTKRKSGARLRSPVPSPPTVSPSSSPNRSRFKVFRVPEVSSPYTSPLAQTPPPYSPLAVNNSCIGAGTLPSVVAIAPSVSSTSSSPSSSYQQQKLLSTSLPTSMSMPSMATVTSSTQSVKRLSMSPRSRFHVSKIYEDPGIPLKNRALPPITPPLNLPPTPIAKNAPKMSESVSLSSVSDDVAQLAVTMTATKQLKSQQQHREALSSSGTIINPNTITPNTITTITTSNTISTNNNELSHNNATTTTTKQKQQKDSSTNAATATTKLSPLYASGSSSTSSSASSSSSSSSTSPASITSSSSSSTSPASSIISSSSSASSSSCSTSTAPASSSSSCSGSNTADNTDSTLNVLNLLPATVITTRCPIAYFNENDITLTKNSVNEALSSAVIAAVANADDNKTITAPSDISAHSTSSEAIESGVPAAATFTVDDAQVAAQQRARKVSWIANQGPVDKLRSLFHNSAIFQRSSSPESKVTAAGSAASTEFPASTITAQTTNWSESALNNAAMQQQQQQHQNSSLVATTRKNSPPTWSSLSAEILNVSSGGGAGGGGGGGCGGVVHCAETNTANVAMSTAAAATATLEQSRSFLDAASKQLRDFSKQVFRQNLNFGNDANNTIISAATAITGVDGVVVTGSSGGGGGGGGGGSNTSTGNGNCGMMPGVSTTGGGGVEHKVTHIPTDVKQEIKENISPEHTINEDTLHSLQKLSAVSVASSEGIVAAGVVEDENVAVVDTKELKELAVVGAGTGGMEAGNIVTSTMNTCTASAVGAASVPQAEETLMLMSSSASSTSTNKT